jgi:4'-phosphopantetheinyl transferase
MPNSNFHIPKSECLWPPASSAARAGEHEIHLWCAALGDFYSELPRFQAMLSPDERVRASRFRSSDDRQAFVVCRGILRQLLAQYLGRDAATIDFSYGRFGKPEIAVAADHLPLYFNTSRSDALAVYAVTSACPVGVDVERLRPVPEFECIASRFFSPFETNSLLALPPDRQMEGFFTAWTSQEALLKATGDGISRVHGSGHIDPGLPAQRPLERDSHASSSWELHVLRPATGYLAAVAHSRLFSNGQEKVICHHLYSPRRVLHE